jgi:hypothetical protein
MGNVKRAPIAAFEQPSVVSLYGLGDWVLPSQVTCSTTAGVKGIEPVEKRYW